MSFHKLANKHTRWMLVVLDSLCYSAAALLILVLYPSTIERLSFAGVMVNLIFGYLCYMVPRFLLKVYQCIWRYANSQEYIWLIVADAVGAAVFLLTRRLLPQTVTFIRSLSLFCLNLLGAIMMRLIYQHVYQKRSSHNSLEKLALKLLRFFLGVSFNTEESAASDHRIKIAIIGAGSIGVLLAEELLKNPKSAYQPVCFVDINSLKAGRFINDIDVMIIFPKLLQIMVYRKLCLLSRMWIPRNAKSYTMLMAVWVTR